MKKTYMISVITILTLFSPVKVSAHCPLCTGGAGVAAAVAAFFGVRYGSIAVFLGGFSVALAFWLSHKIKKQYIQHQNKLVFWAIYLSTIVPFYFMFRGDYVSKYIAYGGDYGSLMNRTYLIDLFIVGAVLGSVIVYFAPTISNWISKKRNGKKIKFQGLIVNFALLIISAILVQVWPR